MNTYGSIPFNATLGQKLTPFRVAAMPEAPFKRVEMHTEEKYILPTKPVQLTEIRKNPYGSQSAFAPHLKTASFTKQMPQRISKPMAGFWGPRPKLQTHSRRSLPIMMAHIENDHSFEITHHTPNHDDKLFNPVFEKI